MASPGTADGHSNTKTEDETTAFRKNRSRRVSFAENTSIHIYDRYDESETPPDPASRSPSSDDHGFTERDSDSKQSLNNEDDDDDDDDNSEPGRRSPFFRVAGSPSSGGSTVSATSNDEDNFFGPVSTSFIRRDLSDCAASDDNHDQTMDSTAFSLHYHSLARSDIEDLKTSTRVRFSFEEKTSTPSPLPCNTSNSMQLTLVNKLNSQPDVTGSHSNDMSIVGEYHDKYDYGKLSPTLDPLLAEDHDDMRMVSCISVLKSQSPIKARKQSRNGPEIMEFSYDPDNKMQGITSHAEHKDVSVKYNQMGVADDGSKLLPKDVSSPNQSIRDTLTVKTNELVKDAFGINSSLEFLATNQETPSNHMSMVHQLNDVAEKENKSSLVRSITHLTDRPSHMLLKGVGLYKSPGTVTPFNNPSSILKRASVSSLQKSISKLRILEASPLSEALTAKLQDSVSRSVAGLSKMTPLDNLDDNKTETPRSLVLKSQLVLPSENTWSGEHVRRTVLRSDIIYGYKDDENTFKFSSNNVKKATPEKFLVSLNRDKEQPIQLYESLEFGAGHVGGLASASDEIGSLYIKETENLTPVIIEGSNIEEMMHERKDSLNDANNNSEAGGNFTKLSNNIEHEKFQSIPRGSDISVGRTKSSLDQSCHKNLADRFGTSPLNKELDSVLHNENNDSFHSKNVPSDVSSADRKRKAELVTTVKNAKIKTSLNSCLELPSGNGMLTVGPNLEHLSEIYTGYFMKTKLLSHSVDKMNLHAIDHLDDILGQLQRSKTYELLSNEVRSQDRRAAETKLILCKFVHEQAKLQLMRVKRDRLLKNVQTLAYGIQESEKLKLNSLQNLLDNQVIHKQSLPENVNDIRECQVDKDKVTSLTHAIKDTDRKISELTKSLHISCKMEGEPNTADTIAYANTYLMKKAQCQIIRKDLQLWVIDNLKSSKDHHEVVLNYQDLLFQRLMVTAGVAPSISISITLNQMNIQKIFKHMDALAAFGFVFNTGLVQKNFTATSMAHETQMTSSLFCNLIDVMGEIQRAKLELKNLIYARFHTSSDESLDLELYFFDTNSGKKATLTLNTSCLRRGIYPSEIVASRIDISFNESQNPSIEKLSLEIAAAVQGLKVGFFRILRLCRCISQCLQSKKGNGNS